MLSGETVRNEKSGTSSLGQSGTKGIYPLRRSPRGGTAKVEEYLQCLRNTWRNGHMTSYWNIYIYIYP